MQCSVTSRAFERKPSSDMAVLSTTPGSFLSKRAMQQRLAFRERVRWIGNRYENSHHLLLVMAGRDRLTWEEVDADWQNPAYLEQHLVGGLSRHDAETFLGKCGVMDSRLQKAVLRVCVDVEAKT